jgi:hypothetical protein
MVSCRINSLNEAVKKAEKKKNNQRKLSTANPLKNNEHIVSEPVKIVFLGVEKKAVSKRYSSVCYVTNLGEKHGCHV